MEFSSPITLQFCDSYNVAFRTKLKIPLFQLCSSHENIKASKDILNRSLWWHAIVDHKILTDWLPPLRTKNIRQGGFLDSWNCFTFAVQTCHSEIRASNDFDANPRRLTYLVKHGESQVQTCKHDAYFENL